MPTQLSQFIHFNTQNLSGVSTASTAMKIQMLRSKPTADDLQQMQTEAIIDLYAMVQQMQATLARTGQAAQDSMTQTGVNSRKKY